MFEELEHFPLSYYLRLHEIHRALTLVKQLFPFVNSFLVIIMIRPIREKFLADVRKISKLKFFYEK